ncbi:hypothetical protein [uncultured Clostridium sp.]|uniref:hypothetical protein n=1 Tax=uncultured Clostridium sp. TaxID=59620 RepID=UPI0025F67774|nr:hypothetical protein [uncultured Clostridium sp.]
MQVQKVLESIDKLKMLNDKNLNFVETAIDSLLVAQSLEETVNDPQALRKIASLIG